MVAMKQHLLDQVHDVLVITLHYNITITSNNFELQLKDTESASKSKLLDLLA